jgi:hypothetical protein
VAYNSWSIQSEFGIPCSWTVRHHNNNITQDKNTCKSFILISIFCLCVHEETYHGLKRGVGRRYFPVFLCFVIMQCYSSPTDEVTDAWDLSVLVLILSYRLFPLLPLFIYMTFLPFSLIFSIFRVYGDYNKFCGDRIYGVWIESFWNFGARSHHESSQKLELYVDLCCGASCRSSHCWYAHSLLFSPILALLISLFMLFIMIYLCLMFWCVLIRNFVYIDIPSSTRWRTDQSWA